jgi:hypothetical protein
VTAPLRKNARRKSRLVSKKSGAPGGTRTSDLLVCSKIVQNFKCCFWCRLQGNPPFISLLSRTEVGGVSDGRVVDAPSE